jgi:hypothetical protein
MSYEDIIRLLKQYSDQPINLNLELLSGEYYRFLASSNFFLEHDRLIIVNRFAHPGFADIFYTLNLDDISEFLKVPRW